MHPVRIFLFVLPLFIGTSQIHGQSKDEPHGDIWDNIEPNTYSRIIRTYDNVDIPEAQRKLTEAEQRIGDLKSLLDRARKEYQRRLIRVGNWESELTFISETSLNLVFMELMESYADYEALSNQMDEAKSVLETARKELLNEKIWRQKTIYNYHSQSNPAYVQDSIIRCRSTACAPDRFLTHPKIEIFQPELERVGAHHAWAKGLTGAGVRIAIEDDFVNYRLPEFAGRVQFTGAELMHTISPLDPRYEDAERCLSASEATRESMNCAVYDFPERENAEDLYGTLPFRLIAAKYGLPFLEKREGTWKKWYVLNSEADRGDLDRWSLLATGHHGTRVASLAAGRDYGIAPGATIIPIALDFSSEGQRAEDDTLRVLLSVIRTGTSEQRYEIDTELARWFKSGYAHYDVINRSFGIPVFDSASISAILGSETQWWGEGLRRVLPITWRALMQTDTPPERRTIVVYASGNETEEYGGLGADLPYYETHVRGSQISVMALGKDGHHAEYTNFCGPLPLNWDAARWGRHFCLAAPGNVNTQSVSGWSWLYTGEEVGTSFAAPIVSGAIALMMEHFRGQLGNTEIVKRMMNTANNREQYAQLEIYGAGLLDLEAALKPVGILTTGTPQQTATLERTFLSLPASVGNVASRLAKNGVEVAALDEWGAPFWRAPSQVMGVRPWIHQKQLTPTFVDVELNTGYFHKGFMADVISIPVGSWNNRYWHDAEGQGFTTVRLLAGDGKIGIERSPSHGFRWGIMQDTNSWMGGYPNGAFGNHIDTTLAWIGRNAQFDMQNGWSLNASLSLAYTHVDLPSDGMLDVEPYLTSTWDVRLEKGIRGEGRWGAFSIAQPPRAETGQGRFTYLSGVQQGTPVYGQTNVSLVPSARETQVKAAYERPLGAGRMVFDVTYAYNFLHEAGLEDIHIGMGYRLAL